MRKKRGVYRVLAGKPQGKKPLARSRCRWEDNIKIDLQEIWRQGLDWSGLGQGQVAGSYEHGNVVINYVCQQIHIKYIKLQGMNRCDLSYMCLNVCYLQEDDNMKEFI